MNDNMKRALELAQEILDVGHVQEEAAERYKREVLAKMKAGGKGYQTAAGALIEMRDSGELREEANDRYQAILHELDAAADGDDEAEEAETEGTATPTRKPAVARKPAARAKSKG